MPILMAFIVGLVFGIGLIVSGMTDPAKVLGFLDLAGNWDPSLAFVMGGAILVGLVAFRIAGRRERSLLGEPMRLPSATRIDRRLVLGSLAFGIGWGLAGYCPGPALASLASGDGKPVVFALAMVAGMSLFELVEWLSGRSAPSTGKA
ncbi:YeeE/YedE family protein [Massilia sp. UMI-21]|nr:YeeE/YedE family protein [Massilia sp. UMI-21]